MYWCYIKVDVGAHETHARAPDAHLISENWCTFGILLRFDLERTSFSPSPEFCWRKAHQNLLPKTVAIFARDGTSSATFVSCSLAFIKEFSISEFRSRERCVERKLDFACACAKTASSCWFSGRPSKDSMFGLGIKRYKMLLWYSSCAGTRLGHFEGWQHGLSEQHLCKYESYYTFGIVLNQQM